MLFAPIQLKYFKQFQIRTIMQKQSFQSLAKQSDEAFRKQFDPNDPSYHSGVQIPVPLNGERVPQTMTTMYPQGYDPNKPVQVIDYGEGYRKVQNDRTTYLNLKKSLAKLCPVVQAFLRHDQIFKQKGDPNNENHLKVHEESVKKQKENLSIVNTQLQAYLPLLEAIGEQGKAFAKQLKEIIEESKKKYENKEELTNFNFKVKKVSTQTFSNAQKCLQKLKDIKKQHAAKANKKQQA